ncbi:MAG: phosphoglycerate kinase [Patescibacteria group bacterium]
MKLPLLNQKKSIKGKKIFLRVDWNVPLSGHLTDEDLLKLERSVPVIRDYIKRGAIVFIATHLGRPRGRDLKFSTKNLGRVFEIHYRLKLGFLGQALDTSDGLAEAKEIIIKAHNGTAYLLENVRFYKGEEKNDPKLSKAFASLADMFVNDAFASCHREHSSVAGIAKYLPHFAGPTLSQEVSALSKLLNKQKRPYLAFIGGAKISTKIEVIKILLQVADKVFIGGAMATAFFAAKKYEIGKSYVEKEGIAIAKKLLTSKKLFLPIDAVIAKKIDAQVKAYPVSVKEIRKTDIIGDIGTETMFAWAAEIKKAKTIVWNGPMGVAELEKFSHGSMFLARVIAARSKGLAYGVIGGGDTLPVILKSGMSEWVDHLSTGGGAMLEFIAKRGVLPGIKAITQKK